MAAHDAADDGQAQAGSAGLAAAGFLQAVERREDPLPAAGRDAGTAIGDLDDELVGPFRQGDRGLATIGDGVVDQVGEGPAQGHRPADQGQAVRPGIGDRLAGIGKVVAQALQQRGDVDLGALFRRRIVAGEGQGGIQHRRHLIQIGQRLGLLLRIIDVVGAQAQPGQRGAQIMGDRRQHQGPVGDQTAQPVLHAVEGMGRLAQLSGPLLRQRRRLHIDAQPVGGGGEAADRRRHPPCRPDADQGDDADREDRPDQGTGHPAGSGVLRRHRKHQPAAVGLADGDQQLAAAGLQIGRRAQFGTLRLVPVAPMLGHVDADRPVAQRLQVLSHGVLERHVVIRRHRRLGGPGDPKGRAVDRLQQRCAILGRGRLHQIDDGGHPVDHRLGEDPGGLDPAVAGEQHEAHRMDHQHAGDQDHRHPSGNAAGPQPDHGRVTLAVKM